MKTLQTDVVIIGAGSAGLTAYKAAKKITPKVVMIEGGEYGTTCARVGCMPSKLLIAAANTNHHALNASPFGINVSKVEVDGPKVMQRVKSERDRFVGFVIEGIESYPPEDLIRGWAKFIDEHTVLVNDEISIESKSFVIATGSRPRVLDEWQCLGDKLQTNDDVFYWDDLPKSIGIVGLGVIGLELGQALTRLGVETHLFGRNEHIGAITDPVVLDKAHQVFGSELNLHLNTSVKVSLVDQKVMVEYQDSTKKTVQKSVDLFLAASGRIANTDHLGLENIDIKVDKIGVPIVNADTMQTSIPHIFLAGDCSNQLPLLHVAADQGHTAGQNAANYPEVQNGLVRSHLGIVFSEPQIAFVGQNFHNLNIEEVIIGKVEFENQGRSRVMLVNHGTLRVYFDKKSKVFIGAEILGPDAEHLGHLLAWAHQCQLTIDEMLNLPFYHPVIEEGLRTALRDAHAQWL